MKKPSDERMSRLSYVLVVCVSIVLLLQLSSTYDRSHCSGSISAPHRQDLPIHKSFVYSTAPAASERPPRLDIGTLAEAAPATKNVSASPPFRLPKLIHQTVINKSRLSCEEKRVIESWKRLNPGYTHRLWDDQDIRQFMLQYYPELVPVPFDEFVKGTERSDLWRVLVLHKFGGVYADMDVECLRPVDEWNADHGHDAAVLLGLENYDAKRKPHRLHVTNWAMAAMPGHPLLALMPQVVTKHIQQQYFALARGQTQLTGKLYEQGILDRTGPAALTAAMYDYFHSNGVDLNKFSEARVNSQAGVIAGAVRVLPVVALSTGWEVADARAKRLPLTCADVAVSKPQALVCHMFWGSWRSTWKTYKQEFTYDNC